MHSLWYLFFTTLIKILNKCVFFVKERLEDQVSDQNPQIEILEERLKLVECELQSATERAEQAELKLKDAEEKLQAPPAPPPPPPPPPPPMLPPPPPTDPPQVPLRRRRSKIAMQELAETIGVSNIRK